MLRIVGGANYGHAKKHIQQLFEQMKNPNSSLFKVFVNTFFSSFQENISTEDTPTFQNEIPILGDISKVNITQFTLYISEYEVGAFLQMAENHGEKTYSSQRPSDDMFFVSYDYFLKGTSSGISPFPIFPHYNDVNFNRIKIKFNILFSLLCDRSTKYEMDIISFLIPEIPLDPVKENYRLQLSKEFNEILNDPQEEYPKFLIFAFSKLINQYNKNEKFFENHLFSYQSYSMIKRYADFYNPIGDIALESLTQTNRNSIFSPDCDQYVFVVPYHSFKNKVIKFNAFDIQNMTPVAHRITIDHLTKIIDNLLHLNNSIEAIKPLTYCLDILAQIALLHKEKEAQKILEVLYLSKSGLENVNVEYYSFFLALLTRIVDEGMITVLIGIYGLYKIIDKKEQSLGWSLFQLAFKNILLFDVPDNQYPYSIKIFIQ